MEHITRQHQRLTDRADTLLQDHKTTLTAHDTKERQTLTNTLKDIQDHIDQALQQQTLYYAVHDATILVFRLAATLMRAEHARLAVRPLAHALLALGVVVGAILAFVVLSALRGGG